MRESEAYPELYQESAARKTQRQGDQHPAGPLRRRRHDGQLDELVPHAGGHARALGARATGSPASASPNSRRGSRGWRRGCRSRRGTSPPNANNAALARGARSIGIAAGDDPAQRQGLLEPGLLRDGLPDQRQAVDAGDDDSRARWRAARRSSRARARERFVLDGDRVDRARRCAAMDADGVRPTARRVTRARARVRRRGRRDRHAGAAAAQPACPIRTASSASARSCIRRSCRRR